MPSPFEKKETQCVHTHLNKEVVTCMHLLGVCCVQIDSWARTNEHKFKVTGIMVTRRVDYHSQGGLTDTLLLDSMAQAATPGDSNGSI